MPEIIGSAARVVDTGDLVIEELAGNVATKSDQLSIAYVKINAPTSEPWLTLHYDEWMCVLKGRMVLHYGDGDTLDVVAGQTVFIAKGERFRPMFPDGNTEYVPVCLPAFRPDRCIREDEPDSAVTVKLQELHGAAGDKASTAAKKPKLSEGDAAAPEVLYHMCQRSLWEKAKSDGEAYFPPTFDADGFTHATAVPSRLVITANHFYQDVGGDWVCLRFRRTALRKLGIMTRDEEAMPVGDKAVGEDWGTWVCPHVFGGIPPQVVEAEYPMLRKGCEFSVIEGLTDTPRRIFKLATAKEAEGFQETKTVASELDKKDGFVHLSDRTSAPVVAKLFFKSCQDLRLIELDADKLPGPVEWIIGSMGDPEPDTVAREVAPSVVHYLKPDGCVHVYGKSGVPTAAIVREVHVPIGPDGMHKFPEWL